ncbi:IucA/IucC family protein [Streptomyces sp. NPDC007088]|uniref:IucA/IucC family protein n=1 Tax=Streptomyces sp. NPDC007088 TaxID=3364773 RepID=UPI0036A3D2DF
MNPDTAPDGRSRLHPREAHGARSAHTGEARAVPRQHSGAPEGEQLGGTAADLLEHPDTRTAAQAAAVENLLRCWVRETGLRAPERGTLRIPLRTQGGALVVPVRYWSAAGWHRFGLPRLEYEGRRRHEELARGATSREEAASARAAQGGTPLDAVTLAALLSREAAAGATAQGEVVRPRESADAGGGLDGRGTGRTADALPGGASPANAPARGATGTAPAPGSGRDPVSAASEGAPAQDAPTSAAPCDDDLVGRVRDSVRRTAVFLTDRRRHTADHSAPFLAAEQSLLLGHPLHPTPKSREGLSEAETRLYSPELRGAFPLHWLAVDRELLATDSAWTERGRTVSAERLTARFAGSGLTLPPGTGALPLHPWQARDLAHRPEVVALMDAGLLTPLGPYGDAWWPTSSVRTVHRPEAAAMLKLSLGLRITNSRRENLRKELHRGVEVHRLLRTGLATQWRAAHPGFDIVRDPAWLAVDDTHGRPVQGLDVMIRHNPFGPDSDAACVAGLVSARPVSGAPSVAEHHPMRSRLAEIVTRLAGLTGRPRGTVAAEWFLRYLEQVVRPVLWLDGHAGVALEAHQQNTVVLLDRHGWPVGGRYRDNQGYYFRTSHRERLEARLPGIGATSDTFVPDAVTDERFAYYLAINNVLGLVGAFGSQGLADERLLLAAFRGFLSDAATGPGRLGSPLPALLLDTPVLRCKANLMTRLHGLDELVGPVDTQSVYVSITNPFHAP